MTDRLFDVEVEFYIPNDVDPEAYSLQLLKIFRIKFENAKTELKWFPGFWASIRSRKHPGAVAVRYSVTTDSDMENVGKDTYENLMEAYPEFFPDGKRSIASVRVFDVCVCVRKESGIIVDGVRIE